MMGVGCDWRAVCWRRGMVCQRTEKATLSRSLSHDGPPVFRLETGGRSQELFENRFECARWTPAMSAALLFV